MLDDVMQQRVGMQVPLHDGLGVAGTGKLDRHCSGGIVTGRIMDFETLEIGANLLRYGFDLADRSHQNGAYQAMLGGEQRAAERSLVFRRRDGGNDGVEPFAGLYQQVEMPVPLY